MHTLLDIKLNSWGAFRPFWGYIHQEPMVLSALKQLDTRFIFVARKDIVAQIVSGQIARRANQWHELSADALDEPFEVDAGNVAYQARLMLLAEQSMFNFLKRKLRVFPVWYEDLFVGGVVKRSLMDWLNENFELKLATDLIPTIKKNNVESEVIIANFDEVRDAIVGVAQRLGRVTFESG